MEETHGNETINISPALTKSKKTKTSPLATLALIFCAITFLSAGAYFGFYTRYTDSLYTNELYRHRMSIFGGAWFFSSAVSVFLIFVAMLHVAFSKKYKGFGVTLWGLLILFLVTGYVLPTFGLAPSVIYKRVANKEASRTIDEFNQRLKKDARALSLRDYKVEVIYHCNTDPQIAEVKYTLKKENPHGSLPQHFSVILNLGNGQKTIQIEETKKE